MIDWSKVKFKIQLEAFSKNGLSDKIMNVIRALGQPSKIQYGKRKEYRDVLETATLIYGKEENESE